MNNAYIGGYLHYNGSTSATPLATSTVTFSKRSFNILVDNLSTTHSMYVSFDGGTTFKTIFAGGSLALEIVGTTSVVIKSAGASQSYEMLVGYID